MTTPFTARLTELIAAAPLHSPDSLPYVRPAFEDTLAVVFAGWGEPVTRRVAALYPGGAEMRPDGSFTVHPEAAALLLGTAAHALDYDDVQLTSCTHPSAPIVAALLGAVQSEPELAPRTTTAYGVGLAANVGLGRVLGFSHYEKGWHATSTIGPLAAAAAVAYLYGLCPADAGHALALAAAQAGGLQRNFGAMAKPLQAGLAGCAGLRAAQLARCGLTADADVFGAKGYFDLYGGAERGEDPDDVEFAIDAGEISVKLHPCCYQTHRPIAVALQAREHLHREGIALERIAAIDVVAPPGSYLPLRVEDPRIGSEGKFCGAYTVACALIDGIVGLSHFEDESVRRPEVRALMERIRMIERDGKPDGLLRRGSPVEMIARDADGGILARSEVLAYPGSPDNPPTAAQREAKVRDCLAYYERRTGNGIDYENFQAFVAGLLSPARRMPRAAAGD